MYGVSVSMFKVSRRKFNLHVSTIVDLYVGIMIDVRRICFDVAALYHLCGKFDFWSLLNEWLDIQAFDLNLWPATTFHPWWRNMTKRKDVASLALLVSWKLWNERNARVFKKKHVPPSVLFH
jgi:hypothetical protein